MNINWSSFATKDHFPLNDKGVIIHQEGGFICICELKYHYNIDNIFKRVIDRDFYNNSNNQTVSIKIVLVCIFLHSTLEATGTFIYKLFILLLEMLIGSEFIV